ncbi:DUF2520 domain-containing protein [Flavobacterium sp. j3]|uniref:DUF2520 domain-containing protein n=1 Tax=Flavobacterium aureirubrum TaxID=3133147 RepID=A0ABU9N6F3_9FLAO
MIKVSVIGSGNVAQHLVKAFSKTTEIELVQVLSRKKEAIAHLISEDKICTSFSELKLVDIVILAISDNAISEVSKNIFLENQLVVHTSGSMSMDAIDDKHRKGVFYPLQTFSKLKEVDFREVPICLEAQNDNDLKMLNSIAQSLSDTIFTITSNQRKALHVAAVFVANFVNHLYQIGYEICSQNELPFDILKPLIVETANKIKSLSPIDAQTGPAKRNDTQTINAHLSFLTDDNQKEIYKLITKSIIDNGKKL